MKTVNKCIVFGSAQARKNYTLGAGGGGYDKTISPLLVEIFGEGGGYDQNKDWSDLNHLWHCSRNNVQIYF